MSLSAMPSVHPATTAATLRFHDAVLNEHIDEAAFLYAQRQLLLGDPDEPWARVATIEQRLEAHIDALALGQERGLELCLACATTESPESLFVATCVICRRGDSSAFASLLKSVGSDDLACLAAFRDALRVECPQAWTPFVERALTGPAGAWVGLLAEVAAHRPLPMSTALIEALTHGDERGSVAHALGKLHVAAARPALWRCLEHGADESKHAALVALLRLGDDDALKRGLYIATTEAWSRIPIGCAAGRSAVHAMLRFAQREAVDKEVIQALGVLGDPAAFPTLLVALSDEDVALHAARALHWMTGAAMFEESFVADPVDEETMTTAELEALKNEKVAPGRSDGRPFGVTVRRLSREQKEWARWIAGHGHRFQAGLRYRAGFLCAPKVILEHLSAPDADASLRSLAALEIDMRYGCRVPFDVAMPVAMQQQALRQMFAWAEAQGDRYADGHWFFAGRQLDS